MIIVAGTAPIQPGKRDEALAVALEMQQATQAEAGCIEYRFYIDPMDDNALFVFEIWESDAALAAHFETPHMATFRERMPEFVAGPLNIKQYAVSDVRDA